MTPPMAPSQVPVRRPSTLASTMPSIPTPSPNSKTAARRNILAMAHSLKAGAAPGNDGFPRSAPSGGADSGGGLAAGEAAAAATAAPTHPPIRADIGAGAPSSPSPLPSHTPLHTVTFTNLPGRVPPPQLPPPPPSDGSAPVGAAGGGVSLALISKLGTTWRRKSLTPSNAKRGRR